MAHRIGSPLRAVAVLFLSGMTVSGCGLLAALATGGGSGVSSGACPVTMPGPAPADFADRLFGSSSAVGNDELWVGGLPPGGVLLLEPRWVGPDGWVGWKLGWWRIAPGRLVITGRRLDGEAPPLRGEAPDGYGSGGFQASGVWFPTEGCWEVTGSVDGATLTFVTLVER